MASFKDWLTVTWAQGGMQLHSNGSADDELDSVKGRCGRAGSLAANPGEKLLELLRPGSGSTPRRHSTAACAPPAQPQRVGFVYCPSDALPYCPPSRLAPPPIRPILKLPPTPQPTPAQPQPPPVPQRIAPVIISPAPLPVPPPAPPRRSSPQPPRRIPPPTPPRPVATPVTMNDPNGNRRTVAPVSPQPKLDCNRNPQLTLPRRLPQKSLPDTPYIPPVTTNNQSMKRSPSSGSNISVRQDSNVSSDSFSQTSSPSYTTKTMEAPLLPHQNVNKSLNAKIARGLLLKEQQKETGNSSITKSMSTPASLQTIVRFQNGSNMSLHHRESFKVTDTDSKLILEGETGDEIMNSHAELVIEDETEEEEIVSTDGNRIVDFAYIYEQLVHISTHNSPLGCNLSCLKLSKEVKKGFLSTFIFTCRMCKVELTVRNCKNPETHVNFDLNDDVVSSFMSIGAAYSGLEQVSASLNIPCMSDKLYAKCHNKVCKLWELAKEKSMEEAAKEEHELAVLNGDVDENGVPMITVVADGCWSKRSYRKNYNALSGAAVIIGYRTKKVLYMAVKNKYCMVCARAEKKKKTIPDHVCFKNYTGSSSGMESTALVEGFKTSKDTHGLIYSRLIVDGDASTHKNIENSKPYGKLLVEKIECTNHLLRNFCTKLDELTKNTGYPLKYRRAVQNNILRLRRAVTGAVKHIDAQKEKSFAQKVLELKKDLLHAPHHVFGDHSSCKPYYCKKLTQSEASTEENLVNEMKSKEGGFIYSAILKCISRLVNNATSLMQNVNSNIAEVFNSVIAKFIGGKRINYSGRQSYTGRCAASVVSFNSKQPQTYISKTVFLRSPNKLIKRLESKRNIKRLASARRRLNKSFTVTSKKPTASHSDKNYGESCEKPDLSETDFNFAKAEHMKNISLSDEEHHSLERRTILQAESIEWRQERKLRITASVFGKVCKRGLIKCGPLVKNILTEKNLDHVKSIQHGQSHEHLARDQLEKQLKTPIKTCGLFIDSDLPFLGASPDGLVEEEKIVEIKCPYSARGISVDDGIREKKIVFWKIDKDGTSIINKNHDWYFQAQGQLHITGRKQCIFAVWTEVDMKVEIIDEDKEFWKGMEAKLKRFYFDCLLPEIIDSRLDRQMEIKEPQYILEAIKKRETEKNEKRKICENKPVTQAKRKKPAVMSK